MSAATASAARTRAATATTLSASKASATRTYTGVHRDGGGAAFSIAIAITFSFATTIVVSRLLAGCRVNASASRSLDSASALSTPRRLLSADAFLPVCLCLLAGYSVASCCAAFALHRLITQPPLTSILNPPSLFVPAGCCVTCCRTASASRRNAGSRFAACGTFTSNLPAHSLLHCHFRHPFSRRRGHHRCPQMHGAISWWRHCQRLLLPLVWLSSSNTSTGTAASSYLQLNHPCPTLVTSLPLVAILTKI